MAGNKKVALAKIKTLTFQRGEKTAFRRTSAIPQLTCVGKPCQVFEPEVVQCTNMGDDGLGNIQWRCDTDLPSSLRLGKVEVSCEGWQAAGDKNVLQGSCGLTYNLHQTNADISEPGFPSSKAPIERFANALFVIVFWGVALTLLYSLIRNLLLRFYPSWAPPAPGSFFPWDGGHNHGRPGGGGGGGGGWGGGGPGFGGGGAGGPPPPPYSKEQTFDQTPLPAATGNNGPGFWTGLAAGGAAAYFAANRANANREDRERDLMRQRYGYGRTGRFDDDDDRGVGSSSNLGEMRRATGFGGSSTR